MFNLSFGEIIIFGIIGLLVIGPKELPRVAKVLGRTIGDLKRSLHQATRDVSKEMNSNKIKLSIEDVMKDKKEEP